ncbi:MAG TPA: hypothetical protein VGD94_20130 [Vicinamibacterales bacterium]
MRNLIAVAASLLLPALAIAQAPMQVGSLTLGETKQIGDIDTDKIKGQPSKIAWSPDGTEIYVQMMEGQFGKPPSKLRHLVFRSDDGKRREVKEEPEWVTDYWTAKSGQASPDSPAFKIELKTETRTQKTVSTPMGGALARGGGVGPDGGTATTGDVLAAAYNQQAVPVNTMMLHGQIVGEYVNSVIVPGQTFGWGPKGSKVIAYSAHNSGRLVVMDERGKRQEFEGTRDAVFPSWSPDGKQIAWLEKDGKKKYLLRVAAVR